MRILVAPQALKGSLDAPAVGEAIVRGILSIIPDAECSVVPVADGGEGTVTALVAATGGEVREVEVQGPLGEPVSARFGLLGAGAHNPSGKRTAVIEMASASGLPLVPAERRNPLVADTFGTGQLILAALDSGCQRILIGIGGSATNDGGAGVARALGVRFFSHAGDELQPGGAVLADLARIDISRKDSRLANTEVIVACDVTNPLTGPAGASAVYGPQKGATPDMVRQLDVALAHYAEVIHRDLGIDVRAVPGGGAAGGLGAGLLAFTRAHLVPGAQLVFDALGFAEKLAGCELVFTAEGQLDSQTAYGKAPGAVAASARAAGVPVVALTGGLLATQNELESLGIRAALPLPDRPLTLSESMQRASELVETAAARAMALIRIGQQLRQD